MARKRLLVPLLVLSLAGTASANPPVERTEEGYVVALEDGELIVDLAEARGAKPGDVVELWRPLDLKHPVTGKRVRDRFRIGSLRLTQVRLSLSLARAEGSLARPVAPGDVIVLRRAAPVPTATAPTEIPKPTPPPGETVTLPESSDPEELEVAQMFDRLRHGSVASRIASYEQYVRDSPRGRFAVVLWEEAQYLRKLLALDTSVRIEVRRFEAPARALAGQPLELGVELAGPAKGVVLHTRNAGEVAYVTQAFEPAGPGYYVARLPGSRVAGEQLELFIEATDVAGVAQAMVASADEPKTVRVDAVPKPTPPLSPKISVGAWTDYADYNRMRGNDVVWQTEGRAGMRFGDTGIRSLGSGFGVFRGVGGSLEELDEGDKSGRRVGLTYGYLEGEFGFSETASLIARLTVGLKDDGVGGGAQALVRIGSDQGTNLQLGGEVLGGIGLRGITQLELATFERIPILFRTEVTNQPAGSTASASDVRPERPGALPQDTSLQRGEIGARAIAQVGYELIPGFVLAARGSYQGRTIKHAGPGFGGAVSYTW